MQIDICHFLKNIMSSCGMIFKESYLETNQTPQMGILYLRDRCQKEMSKIVWMSCSLEITLFPAPLKEPTVTETLCRTIGASIWAVWQPSTCFILRRQNPRLSTWLPSMIYSTVIFEGSTGSLRLCKVEWWLPSSSPSSQGWRNIIWHNVVM